jgi:hypothetical protein
MSKIFISYRRQDTRDVTGRIYDRLLRHWDTERIFKDVDNIAPGEDYRDVIDREISDCSLLLAVIGPSWLAAKKADGKRRLDDATDMVRIEIETALKRERRVIPILVSEARMPEPEDLPETLKELADRHAFAVRPDPDFHRDMDRLVQLIERAMESSEPLLAELIDPGWTSNVIPPPIQRSQFEPPHVHAPHAGPHPYVHQPYGAAANPYASPSGKAAGEPAPMLWQAATALSVACLIGLGFCSLMLIGAFASLTDPEGVDKGIDAFMAVACGVGWVGDLLGLGAAGCIFFRKFYWPAVICVGSMGLATLIFCPILNLPAAAFALYVLLQPGARAAFDQPAPTSAV